MSTFATTLAILLASCLALYRFRTQVLAFLTPKGIHGFPKLPNAKPIIGDLPTLIEGIKRTGGMGAFADELSLKYGPLIQIRVFQKIILITCDYSGVLPVVTDRSGTFGVSETVSKYFKQIIPYGPSMSANFLLHSEGNIKASVDSLVRLWRLKGQRAPGKAWRVTEDLEDLTMDVISGLVFGVSWKCVDFAMQHLQDMPIETSTSGEFDDAPFKMQRPPLAKAAMYVLESMDFPRRQFPAISHFILRQGQRYRHDRGLLRKYIKTQYDLTSKTSEKEKGEDGSNATSMMDLMRKKDANGQRVLSPIEVEDEALTMLFGGTETTASVLEWWCKFMIQHPEIQVKLRDYIKSVCLDVDGEIQMAKIGAVQTPYLEAMVHETLRLSRASPGSARLVEKHGATILGKPVPKGMTFVWLHCLGYQNEHGSEGVSEHLESTAGQDKLKTWERGTILDFKPERWLDSQGEFDPHAGPYLPFSHGVRACFGKSLAFAELRYAMAALNQAFFFASLTEEQASMKSKEAITRRPICSFLRPVGWDDPEARQAVENVKMH